MPGINAATGQTIDAMGISMTGGVGGIENYAVIDNATGVQAITTTGSVSLTAGAGGTSNAAAISKPRLVAAIEVAWPRPAAPSDEKCG